LRHEHRSIRESRSATTAIAGEEHYHYTQEDLMTYAEELLQEGMGKGLEQGLERGLEQGLERGIQKGQLQDKRDVLTRLLSRRFELTDAERELIASSDDPDALDAALDEFAVASEKASVLSKLRS
jgi:flagellar biosynthesis/type III secretory pathway protein FliH